MFERRYQQLKRIGNMIDPNHRLLILISVLSHTKSIYEGLRRPRWSQFASEIYKVDTIVYGTYVSTWSYHLFVLFQLLLQLLQVQFRYRLKIPKKTKQDSGYTSKSKIFAPSWKSPIMYRHYHHINNSVTVNSVGVNRKKQEKTRHGFADACMMLAKQITMPRYVILINYIYLAKEMGSDLLHLSSEGSPQLKKRMQCITFLAKGVNSVYIIYFQCRTEMTGKEGFMLFELVLDQSKALDKQMLQCRMLHATKSDILDPIL